MKLTLRLAIWTLCLQVLALALNSHHDDVQSNEIIPHRLLFTYKTNMLETKEPKALYDNVQNTIQKYSQAWNVSVEEVDVVFMDDELCLELIPQVEPRLVEYFQLEPLGSFKADICRVAALYLYGGYYFDVDIQVLEPLHPQPETDFITSTCGNNQFFQAVLALSRRHPLARATLDSMLNDWYSIPSVVEKLPQARIDANFSMGEEYNEARGDYLASYFNMSHEIKPMLGTATLRMAYDRHRNLTSAWILDELDNEETPLYPEFKREETGWGCNYMVHDAPSEVPYFYSRCLGTDGCPRFKPRGPELLRRSAIGNAMARRRSRLAKIKSITGTASTPVDIWWKKRKSTRPGRISVKGLRKGPHSSNSTLVAVLLFILVLVWIAMILTAAARNYQTIGKAGKKNC